MASKFQQSMSNVRHLRIKHRTVGRFLRLTLISGAWNSVVTFTPFGGLEVWLSASPLRSQKMLHNDDTFDPHYYPKLTQMWVGTQAEFIPVEVELETPIMICKLGYKSYLIQEFIRPISCKLSMLSWFHNHSLRFSPNGSSSFTLQ